MFWSERWCDRGVCAVMSRNKFGMGAEAVAGAFGLNDDGVVQQPV